MLISAAWPLAVAPTLSAQVTRTLEAAVSRVHYDEFLPSGAASLGAAVAVQGRSAALSGRGSYLLFESGRSTWQAALAGSYFAPRLGPTRPELWAATGGSRYVSYPSFWHAIGGARFHFAVERGTVWLDASGGGTSFGDAPRPVAMLGAGLWTRRYGPALTLAATYVRVGDTTYADLQGTARAHPGRLELDGVLGARVWSRGGGRGVYAEATVAVALGGDAALVIGGGRYPTDPTRGTISGRYVSAGVRLRTRSPGRYAPARGPAMVAVAGSNPTADGSAAARLELRPDVRGAVRLIVHAPAATSVEIAGDFTDWQPLPLQRAAAGRWEGRWHIPPGPHRINVRLDGGPWIVPAGTTPAADDYGGTAGLFLVP
ncbi:MAG: glycogen-binding domain-containing protein [Gemmatimonadales bacterium]